ncbi:MAG: hypothetical protein JXR10_15860 [Cyclobacteriaceae bacterium]
MKSQKLYFGIILLALLVYIIETERRIYTAAQEHISYELVHTEARNLIASFSY